MALKNVIKERQEKKKEGEGKEKMRGGTFIKSLSEQKAHSTSKWYVEVSKLRNDSMVKDQICNIGSQGQRPRQTVA